MVGYSLLHQGAIAIRFKRYLPCVPKSITEAAGGNDVMWRVLPAIAASLQVLGSGAKQHDLSSGQCVGVCMLFGIGQPHRPTAVEAQAALLTKCAGAQSLDDRVV